MKVGLFFGSFNPIHIGHLIIAHTLVENTDYREVWFVISPQNPFKKQKDLLHEFDRYDLVEQAVAEHPHLRVSDVEFQMPRPSYTIDTLTVLQEKHPEKQFALIMGSDNLHHFKKWKNYEKILEYFSLLVYPRPGTENHDWKDHPHVQEVEAPLLNISATYIRRQIQQNKSIKYLVPEAVEAYILRKKFYL